ncbi:MAG TPA: transcription termination/antitermination NusG family protein [Candidatus Cybelea sp.]|nr:transcription termination/antitermination NusG family protein [Candidatus Cybelea sp.]
MAATYEIGQFVGYVEVEPAVDIMPTEGSSYYVMLTEPGREMTAQTNLLLRHIPFYLPTIFKKARISAGRQARGEGHPDILTPLFPRVIFIATEVVSMKMRHLQSTPGMTSSLFMRFGEREALLRPLAIQVIRYIEAGERELYWREAKRKLVDRWLPEVGDEVRFLVNEVMGGRSGKVSEVDEQGRITLLMEIMKRTVRVRATANQIDPV